MWGNGVALARGGGVPVRLNFAFFCGVGYAAVSRSGSVWAWGSGEYGATGLGDLETKRVPWVIQTGLTGQTVIQGALRRWV